MKDLATLNARKLQIAKKNGETLEELADKYGCTEEELIARINEIHKKDSKAEETIKDFSKKSKKKVKKSEETTDVVPEDFEEPMNDTENESRNLEAEEKSLSEELISLETQREELFEKYRAKQRKLAEYDNRFEKLQKDFIACQQGSRDVSTEMDKIAEEISSINSLRREKQATIKEVRRQIEEKNRVTLCVSADGVIEAPDNPDFVLEDTGFQTIKAEIQDLDVCLDLTNRDTITLARLLKMCEQVENLILVCDHAELEKAFWAIRQQ